jgi:long-subunit acyl-CoA synthetase (AMP-forming)
MNTNAFFATLARMPGTGTALVTRHAVVDHAELIRQVTWLSAVLRHERSRIVATMIDNGAAWVIADLAALAEGLVHVPVPSFFTPQQVAFVLDAAGVDTVIAHQPVGGFSSMPVEIAGETVAWCRRPARDLAIHEGTAKITFTSGTTGTPKGVCLSADAMLAVAGSLATALRPIGVSRHLCALPLPVLLENVAGVYAPLLAGAASVVVACGDTGLEGSSRFDPSRLDAAMRRFHADSVVVLPQMLRAWTAWRARNPGDGLSAPRFVAVGGAGVGRPTIEQARATGLPAYEGYGLSEGASVQTLNLPGRDRPGSVGPALDHARVRVSPDGEIEIAGSLMLGYLGEPRLDPQWWPTGDLGEIDADRFIHVRGRRRHVLVTAFGRNVSPEWVESLLHAQPAIAHAVVQGDGRPALEAVIWPAHEAVSDAELAQTIAGANRELPDYARIQRFVRGRVPYGAAHGVCTANGRPLRAAIGSLHAAAFAAQRETSDVVL